MVKNLRRSLMLVPGLVLMLSLNLGVAAMPKIDPGHYCYFNSSTIDCYGSAYTCYCMIVWGN